MTDNKTRTAKDVRALFKKHGGSLGTDNSVSWNWHRSAVLRLHRAVASSDEQRDTLIGAAIDAGADDVDDDESLDDFAVYLDPKLAATARDALQSAGFAVESTQLVWRPGVFHEIEGEEAQACILTAIEALLDHQDVTAVYHNVA